MLFYYAYVADADANGGVASQVAKGCAAMFGLNTGVGPSTGGGRKRCNFNEFISYINGIVKSKSDLSKMVSVTDDLLPDVDSTADALWKKGLTGFYDIGRTLAPKGSLSASAGDKGQALRLMQAMSDCIYDEKWLDKTSNTVKNAARLAARTGRDGRKAANLIELKNAVLAKFPDAKIPGAGITDPNRESTEA